MKRAHFICRRLDNAGHDGLDLVGHLGEQHVYRSDAWAIRPADAEALVGGLVYFHEHKNEPSTFGGTELAMPWALWRQGEAGGDDHRTSCRRVPRSVVHPG